MAGWVIEPGRGGRLGSGIDRRLPVLDVPSSARVPHAEALDLRVFVRTIGLFCRSGDIKNAVRTTSQLEEVARVRFPSRGPAVPVPVRSPVERVCPYWLPPVKRVCPVWPPRSNVCVQCGLLAPPQTCVSSVASRVASGSTRAVTSRRRRPGGRQPGRTAHGRPGHPYPHAPWDNAPRRNGGGSDRRPLDQRRTVRVTTLPRSPRPARCDPPGRRPGAPCR